MAPKQDMSASVPAQPDSKKDALTGRDLEILSQAWNCMKTQPEMDYDKLANACGMTNPRSASNAWSSIKKKLFASVPLAEKPEKAGKKAASTPRKRKKGGDGEDATNNGSDEATTSGAQKSEEDGEDNDEKMDVDSTPAKKKRATPAKKAAAKKVKNEDGSDAEEEAKPKPKQMAKRPKAAAKAKKPKNEPTSDSDDAAEGASMVPAVVVNDEEEEDVDGAV